MDEGTDRIIKAVKKEGWNITEISHTTTIRKSSIVPIGTPQSANDIISQRLTIDCRKDED